MNTITMSESKFRERLPVRRMVGSKLFPRLRRPVLRCRLRQGESFGGQVNSHSLVKKN